jgi:hypothetical protein
MPPRRKHSERFRRASIRTRNEITPGFPGYRTPYRSGENPELPVKMLKISGKLKINILPFFGYSIC